MSDLQSPPLDDVEAGVNSEPQNRRLLIGLAAAVGVLVLGAAAYFLFLSGGDEPDLAPITKGTPAAQPKEKAEKSGGEGVKVPPAVDKNLEVGRDPFKKLAAEAPVPAPEESGDPSDGVAIDDGGTVDPGDDTVAPPSAGGVTVYKVEVNAVNAAGTSAKVSVNGQVYNVKNGAVFPSKTTGPFKITSIDAGNSGVGRVKLIFGSGLPATLKEGVPYKFGQS